MLRLRQAGASGRRVRCRPARFTHSTQLPAVWFTWKQKHCSSSGHAANRVGSLTEQNLTTQAFDSGLEAAQRDLALELMSSRSMQSAHLRHHSITEQNAIDRPVDVSFSPNFTQMHVFTLGQQLRPILSAACWVNAKSAPTASGEPMPYH